MTLRNIYSRGLALGLLLGSLFLPGCGALVVGGAAAGGYYLGKDARTLGEITDDATITSTINSRYVKDSLVPALDINVDTYRGVVTLYGSVGSRAVAERAVAIARSVKGVKRVVSKLTVVPG
ncbi:BON domain-containing protein [Thiohalobacter sp. IOR34]|uniref:BON domain-containing protein n=1 Tax=Thiohalobacter sp. IOR34 TaxID=3057176 RepID=UPI0025B0039A|nr:BON domain-containing protein [Thiohalobacter sp. IOR34]WJW76031.1 BON domain-containing protein [Thiohalobacter sp. IOR34]